MEGSVSVEGREASVSVECREVMYLLKVEKHV